MNSEFSIIIIAITCFISGFLLGITLGRDRYQKKISKILDEALKEKNKNYNPYLLTGEELKRTEEARIRGEK